MKVKGKINVYDNGVVDYLLENGTFILQEVMVHETKRKAKAAAERLAEKLNLKIQWEEL